MRSVLKAALVLAVVVLGAIGTLGVTLAQTVPTGPPEEKHQGLVGTINTKGPTSFTLDLKRKGGDPQGTVTINVVTSPPNPTKFKIPGDKTPTYGELSNGDRVAVLGKRVSGTTYDALHVNRILGKGEAPPHAHRVGIITACLPNCTSTPPLLTSITLAPKKGGTSDFAVPTTAKLTTKKGAAGTLLGKRAVVIVRRDPTTGLFTVTQIQVFAPKP